MNMYMYIYVYICLSLSLSQNGVITLLNLIIFVNILELIYVKSMEMLGTYTYNVETVSLRAAIHLKYNCIH